MGKATRWFRGLLGKKKDRENVDTNSNTSSTFDNKKRWSFAKSSCNNNDSVVVPPKDSAVWLRSYIADTENDHAIAVAAAAAAAAVVAAAQAAVAVVRLTSHGGLRKEKSADPAVKIQTVFRGYLARKALGALKGLVKLQALVRGYLVRKRAAITLHSMQALIRAQATVRYQRACRSINNKTETRSRKSIERFDETRSEYHSQRLSASYDPSFSAFEKSSKIVEIDTCGPRSRSRRMNPCMSEYGDDDHYYHAVSGPLLCPVPARLSIPDCRHIQEFDWGFVRDDYKFATAQSTPRMACSGRANMPITPPKSICGDSFFRPYAICPSYMANTESFRAKLRSLSAPKQRPEPCTKKRLSLNEIMASRTSFSGVKMQRSRYPQVEEEFEYEER